MNPSSRWARPALTSLLSVLALLAVASCRKPLHVPLDQPVSIHVRQGARFRNSDLDLYFRRVASDSRCPRGAQCIWAGDAVLTFEGRILKAPAEAFDVRFVSDTVSTAVFDGYRITVQRLDPYPVAGEPRDTTAYVATIVVEKR